MSSCPGTESSMAGKSKACEGCPNQSTCSTSSVKSPDPDLVLIDDNLSQVRNRILILSGKGGVGKSTMCNQMARAFADQNEDLQIGLLDVDLCGPSQPIMMGVEGERLHSSQSGWTPIVTGNHGNLLMVSIGFLLENSTDAVIWRGPKKNGMMKQFLKDVQWEKIDYLFIDTPPGTSDEHLTLVQLIKPITGAILVTTPQEISWQDVRKEIDFCQKTKIPILGIIENMKGFVCPNCNLCSKPIVAIDDYLEGNGKKEMGNGENNSFSHEKIKSGSIENYCKENNLNYLGSIPLDPRIGSSCDEGFGFCDLYPESEAAHSIRDIKLKIENLVSAPDHHHVIDSEGCKE